MARGFEELGYSVTPLGALSLRRRPHWEMPELVATLASEGPI